MSKENLKMHNPRFLRIIRDDMITKKKTEIESLQIDTKAIECEGGDQQEIGDRNENIKRKYEEIQKIKQLFKALISLA